MARTKKIDSGYKEQLDLQKYANQRRQEIQDFLEKHHPTFMTLHEAKQGLTSGDPHYENKLYAILDPQLVASLPYKPVRLVTKIREIDPERIQWLINYWEERYEVDISDQGDFGEWNHEVGLNFISSYWDYDYHTRYYYDRTYDFPSCLIATFLLVKKEE